MAKGINFVANRRKRLTAQQVQDEKWFQYAIIGVIVVFVVFLITIGLRFFFLYRINALKDNQANARKAIEAQEQVEKDYNVFAHKLRALSDLFGKRQDKQEAMVYFSQVFGPQVIISGIDYSEDDNSIVSFTLTAPSVFDLENVFTVLESDEVLSKYAKVQKSDLGRGESGAYSIKLTIILGGSTYLEDVAASAQEGLVQDTTENEEVNQ
ncbi:MAG: hypothetical protein GW762_03115 [Candidatus Pacebacteria bacterium]|nr:hypothetical protein [Candidatus Paceibacterota bacterium]PIR64244.1 MAG: hypothetical protein COU64_00190 [Candidatus Pacebacteria bacterium CG10_big_fil_rev_8_21_14_0_10_40_26]PIZ79063.1 MAG: hypothetical protein COY01_01390 [Candidatus Pacebacteria bacterium CG_4_10_14_0_2_um_filter_40_20]PJA69249.1 MAG: hypothetical protein CO156_01445 [Candidatus Pacebacteria bacterium CG_4_9_14_3_um_filter_40_12]PJC42029.1 MAG: hypothetical protein CO041_00100 [Candidatus Pacebacteria bacterium CG_4_9_